jgi:transposase
LASEVIAQVLADTVTPPPEALQAQGVTHWSSRRLADWLGRHRGITISHDRIGLLWRKFCLQPHRVEGFKFSTDPELDAKIRDVVGIYLDPPKGAVVVCVDAKSQIQALDRTQPVLPMRPGRPERQTHDYKRHGTTTLFAALEIATGKVTDACKPRHRHQEFLAFLRQVAKAHPRVPLHVVCDNYATPKHPTVKAWLAKNPRVTLHFTPTSCSWLNLVECFFSIITRQAIRRGTYTSVADLTGAIEAYIDGWNEQAHPFTWSKTADELLANIESAKAKTSRLTVH